MAPIMNTVPWRRGKHVEMPSQRYTVASTVFNLLAGFVVVRSTAVRLLPLSLGEGGRWRDEKVGEIAETLGQSAATMRIARCSFTMGDKDP